MHLIEIFLPLFNNSKRGFDPSIYDTLELELKDKFGGVTFYRNTPAEGLWKDEAGKTNYDELIIAEVMVNKLEMEWWQQLKVRLEQTFQQKEILIRVFEFEKL
jgi:hypothetical protein